MNTRAIFSVSSYKCRWSETHSLYHVMSQVAQDMKVFILQYCQCYLVRPTLCAAIPNQSTCNECQSQVADGSVGYKVDGKE
jgi:hypothetical protein